MGLAVKIKLTKRQEDKILELYRLGMNRETIAPLVHTTEHGVKKTIKKFRKIYDFSNRICELNEQKTIKLNEHQLQCIIGTLLGDGSLSIKPYGQISYSTSHGLEQRDYLKHISSVLRVNWHKYVKNENSYSAGKDYYKLNYYNKYELLKIAKFVLANKRKTITKEWCDQLTAEGLAYWFMDDGSSCNSGSSISVEFSTLSFTLREINMLRDMLFIKFGIYTTIRKHGNDGYGRVISLRQISVNRFMDLIEPYIVDCLKYKIKKRKCETLKINHHHWISDKQKQFILKNYNKLSTKTIADILHINQSTVLRIQTKKYGNKPKPEHLSENRSREILDCYIKCDGNSNEVCKKFGITHSMLYHIRAKYGIKASRPFRRLSNNQIKYILNNHGKMTLRAIARILHINKCTVSDVWCRYRRNTR